KKSIHRLRGITQTSISFILGTAVLLPILLLLQRPVFAGITTDNIGMILYIGIMITGLGYLTYFLSMEASDAATASIVFFVKPALAPIFAVIVLHEVISISGLLGILLILTGSYISLREQKSKMMIKDDIE
ncbi:MAG: DMT family transporter, partial [Eubacteriales bacterium]|nr:DMT family transporter [Eubacteriales bacterium]